MFDVEDLVARYAVADRGVPHLRVILVVPPGAVQRVLQRPRHRLVVSILEKPQVCERIQEVVRGTLVELAPGEAAKSSA